MERTRRKKVYKQNTHLERGCRGRGYRAAQGGVCGRSHRRSSAVYPGSDNGHLESVLLHRTTWSTARDRRSETEDNRTACDHLHHSSFTFLTSSLLPIHLSFHFSGFVSFPFFPLSTHDILIHSCPSLNPPFIHTSVYRSSLFLTALHSVVNHCGSHGSTSHVWMGDGFSRCAHPLAGVTLKSLPSF